MITINNRLKSLTLSAAIALAAPSAFAQGFGTVSLATSPNSDSGTAGTAVISTYQYQGSDERRTLVLPVLNYQWANGWFAGISNGIGYNFSQSEQLQYGLRLTADGGRKTKRSIALRGMSDINAAAEGGAFLNYSPIQGLILNSSVRYGAGSDHKGVVVDLGADYTTAIAENWYFNAGTAITFTNANYMQSFFGVTGAQSTTSGYATRTADAGARDVRAKVALTYSINPKTSITGAVSVSSLLNDAKNSALTRKQTSGSGVVAVNYMF
jgi:MipA family protein